LKTDPLASATGATVHMEQTSAIGRYDGLHIGQRVQLPVGHGDRHLRSLHREESPEPTTLLVHLPRDHCGTCGLEEPQGLLFHTEFSERVTTVMIGQAAPLQTTSEFGDLEDVHEELAQLVGAFGHCGRFEQTRVRVAKHRRTASGREDHIIRVGEDLSGVSGHFTSLGYMA
jgi:hypothetical protein